MICLVSLLWQDTLYLVRCHDIVYFLATRHLPQGRIEERNYLELRSWQTIFSFSSVSCNMHQGFGKRLSLYLTYWKIGLAKVLKCTFFFVSKGKYKDGSAVLTGQGGGRENLFCQGLPGKKSCETTITRLFESFSINTLHSCTWNKIYGKIPYTSSFIKVQICLTRLHDNDFFISLCCPLHCFPLSFPCLLFVATNLKFKKPHF